MSEIKRIFAWQQKHRYTRMSNHIKLTIHRADTSSRLSIPMATATVRAGFPSPAQDYMSEDIDLNEVAALLQARTEVFTDIPEMVDFFDKLPAYGNDLYTHKKMKTNPENSLESLKAVLPVLESLEDWSMDGVHEALFSLIGELGVKNGIILWPLRVALSGKPSTPGGAVELAHLLGKEDSIQRVKKGIEQLS